MNCLTLTRYTYDRKKQGKRRNLFDTDASGVHNTGSKIVFVSEHDHNICSFTSLAMFVDNQIVIVDKIYV